jgi:hypothetical protein
MSQRDGCPPGEVKDKTTNKCDTENNHLYRSASTQQYLQIGNTKVDAVTSQIILSAKTRLRGPALREFENLPLEKQAQAAWRILGNRGR